MSNLIVFGVIGLFAGAAVRLLYPGRQPGQILGSLALGAAGGLVGGMISWMVWPAVEGQFQSGNLFLSLLGAVVVLVAWAGVSYARSVSGSKRT